MNKSYKAISYGSDAIKKVLSGVNMVANAVKVTLGPNGKFVMYMRYGVPTVTKDGVSVAKEIDNVQDEETSFGCELAKKVASDTVDACGDGTTTATVLFQAICNEASTYALSGMSPNEVRKGMHAALQDVVEHLKAESIQVGVNDGMLEDVATISANGDRKIGQQISQMMKKIGPNGVINVEKGKSLDTEFEYVEGMEFDGGCSYPYFMNNTYKKTAELESPYIIVSEEAFDSPAHAKKIYELLETKIPQASLVIISPDCQGFCLKFLVQNVLAQTIKACPAKAPSFGDNQKEILSDIATFTGAQKLSSTTGLTIDKLDVSHLGRADKVIISDKSTVIVNGHGNSQVISDRLAEIRHQIQDAEKKKDTFVTDRLEKRYAALSGIVCNYKIGGRTEIEQNELKDRVDDAVRAVKAALEAGIVPGGASCYVRASRELQNKLSTFKSSSENSIAFLSGYGVIIDALLKPISQALENAGMGRKSQLIIEQIANGPRRAGFNIATQKFEEDMIQAGVCDAAKCVISALEFAVSYADSFINTECLITNKIDKTGTKDNDEMY